MEERRRRSEEGRRSSFWRVLGEEPRFAPRGASHGTRFRPFLLLKSASASPSFLLCSRPALCAPALLLICLSVPSRPSVAEAPLLHHACRNEIKADDGAPGRACVSTRRARAIIGLRAHAILCRAHWARGQVLSLCLSFCFLLSGGPRAGLPHPQVRPRRPAPHRAPRASVIIPRLSDSPYRRQAARNKGFLTVFSLSSSLSFSPQPVGSVGLKSGAAQFRTFSARDRGPLSAAVEGFTGAASSVSAGSPRSRRRKLLLNPFTVRRPDVSRGGAVCRAQHTGSLPSGRTEPGTMGSRGGAPLATLRQVRNHRDRTDKTANPEAEG